MDADDTQLGVGSGMAGGRAVVVSGDGRSRDGSAVGARVVRVVVVLVVIAAGAYFGVPLVGGGGGPSGPAAGGGGGGGGGVLVGSDPAATQGRVVELMRAERSGEMVVFDARVVKTLPDDNDGARHQRFLLAIDAGGAPYGTVLVAHNIDLAERVPLAEGDTVRLNGQYEFNDKGGVVHWTHHDPAGRHEGGWIEHAGVRYE